MINIAGLSKAAVLAALYNGTLSTRMQAVLAMTVDEAQAFIDENDGSLRFDYVKGRPLKVDLTRDEFNEARYDRDAGPGRAAEVIKELCGR